MRIDPSLGAHPAYVPLAKCSLVMRFRFPEKLEAVFPGPNTQVKVLYQRAIELKKEGRTAEAMACLKRAKSLEADLLRDAQGKGLIDKGEGEGGELARRPSLLRQTSCRRSSAAVSEPAARKESR